MNRKQVINNKKRKKKAMNKGLKNLQTKLNGKVDQLLFSDMFTDCGP